MFNPVAVATAVYGLSLIFYLIFLVSGKRRIGRVATGITLTGLIIHAMGLAMRIGESRRMPLTNTYETLLLFSWLVIILYLILEKGYKLRAVGIFVIPIALLSLMATSLVSPEIEPLDPRLRSPWFGLHILTTFTAYALFALSFGLSIVHLSRPDLSREEGKKNRRWPEAGLLDELNYRILSLGFPLLTLGVVAGAVWANNLWGSYWNWDPKETWSFITWMIYLIYLHLRLSGSGGSRCRSLVSIIGFLSAMFMYFGVNYLYGGH